MDRILYWIDRSDWPAALAHHWVWFVLTVVLSVATIVGMRAVIRYYDRRDASAADRYGMS